MNLKVLAVMAAFFALTAIPAQAEDVIHGFPYQVGDWHATIGGPKCTFQLTDQWSQKFGKALNLNLLGCNDNIPPFTFWRPEGQQGVLLMDEDGRTLAELNRNRFPYDYEGEASDGQFIQLTLRP